MPPIDRVVDSFEQLGPPAPVNLVLSDGDDTLFPHGSPEPYPDSLEYLKMLEPDQLILVSGNPDKRLAQARVESIAADTYFVPNKRPRWVKYKLFTQTLEHALTEVDRVNSAVVLGNRWFMDVAIAKLALQRSGVRNVEGILVQRGTTHQEIFDRLIINPVQFVGATALKNVGLDSVFRPRKTPNP